MSTFVKKRHTIQFCRFDAIFVTCHFVLQAILTQAIIDHAILSTLLFLLAAILTICSIVHAILSTAIFVPAQLSGHRLSLTQFACLSLTHFDLSQLRLSELGSTQFSPIQL